MLGVYKGEGLGFHFSMCWFMNSGAGLSTSASAPGADTMINLRAGALATSGDARRFLISDGIRYGHIIDPTTGWPVVNAPRSVTVAADTCTQAGMLSTFAMLKGAAAEEFLAAGGGHCRCSYLRTARILAG